MGRAKPCTFHSGEGAGYFTGTLLEGVRNHTPIRVPSRMPAAQNQMIHFEKTTEPSKTRMNPSSFMTALGMSKMYL